MKTTIPVDGGTTKSLNLLVALRPVAFIAFLLVLWQIAVSRHPDQLLPGPIGVAHGIVDLLSHGLLLKYAVAALFRMSCILVVRQDLIDGRPDVVQVLVDGIARSGLWLDTSKPHREDAADFVGRFYYNQKPALLRWALTKPMDRVMYSPLAPRKADFDMVRDLMIETRVLNKKLEFDEYTDTRFSDKASIQTPWRYEPGTAFAR